MSAACLSMKRDGPVFEIVLDRPKANAIDAATSRAMGEAFDAFEDDPDLRVAILCGAGERFFSAGWDLTSAGEGDEDFGPNGFGGLMANERLGKPVIAALNGMAVGGGFEIALACDFVVMAEHAECFLTEPRLGFLSDPASVARLMRRCPRNIALEILLAGRRLNAAAAERFGFANRVCTGPEVGAQARRLARDIASAAPLPVDAAKTVVGAVEGLNDAAAARALSQNPLKALYERIHASEDYHEGLRAFAEKRPPVWKGR